METQMILSNPTMAIRALPNNRIGGILIPFNSRDKYKTWWDRNSDLKLDLYSDRPLFHWHLLRAKSLSEIVPAGSLLRDSFEVRDEGLYVEAIPSVNSPDHEVRKAARAIMELVEQGDAAWSSGALPQAIRVRGDGYVECWPIVEGSIASRDGVVSMRGTTTAYHVRAALDTNFEAADEQPLSRSIWIMSETNGAQPNAPTTSTPAPVQLSNEQIDAIVQRMQAAAPTRSLPPSGQLPSPVNPPASQPQISVSSPYDDVSLLGLCFYDEMNRLYAHSRGHIWRRDEKFMRAVVDKARVVKEREDKHFSEIAVPDDHVPFRAVDDVAYQAWHERVPYLRANEAMQSTLTSYGDELVPTLLNSTVWLGFRLATKVFGLFGAVRCTGTTYDWPVMSSGPTTRLVLESTAQSQMSLTASPYPVSKMGTSKVTFTNAGKLGTLALITYELFRDSGINLADAAANRFLYAMASGADAVLLNGHKSASVTNWWHYGTDPTGTNYDKALLMNGLRRIAVGASTHVAVATVDKDYFTTIRKKMGTRGNIGTDIQNVVGIIDPGVYWKMLSISELLTVQNYGPQAVIHTGEVASLTGVPAIVSDEMEYTNASGQIPDTHAGTVGGALTVHRELIKIGLWRDIDIVKWDVQAADAFAIKGSMSFDVQQLESGAVAYGYNSTV